MTDPTEIVDDDQGQPWVRTRLVDELQGIRAEQAAGFASLAKALEHKADKADVAKLEARLDEHQRDLAGHRTELDALRQWQNNKDVAKDVHKQRDREHWTERERTIAILSTAAILLLMVVAPIIDRLVLGA